MKVKVNKTNIQKAISSIEGIISVREIRSVLSNILIEANQDQLVLTASNINITLSQPLLAEVSVPGSISLPARKLSQIINVIKGDSLYLESDKNNSVSIQNNPDSSGAQITLMGSPASDYPATADVSSDKYNPFSVPLFLKALDSTSYAMAKEDVRYVFNGTFIMTDKEKTLFVATDGRRLAFNGIDLKNPFPVKESFILPYLTVKELQKQSGESGEGSVAFDNDNKRLCFKIGNLTIISKTIDGTFPNYKEVIPDKVEHELELKTEEFINAVNQVSIMGAEPSRQLKIKFDRDTLGLYASTPDLGEAQDNITIDYKGEGLEMAFNSYYLLEAVKSMDTETFKFGFSSSSSPAVIRRPDDDSLTAVIMPMNI